MIGVGPNHRYFFYRPPTDMRKSFDGLCGLIKSGLKKDPLSGDVFVFVNRRRTLMKLILWDRNGFLLCYKRLEEGTFELPPDGEPMGADDDDVGGGIVGIGEIPAAIPAGGDLG